MGAYVNLPNSNADKNAGFEEPSAPLAPASDDKCRDDCADSYGEACTLPLASDYVSEPDYSWREWCVDGRIYGVLAEDYETQAEYDKVLDKVKCELNTVDFGG